MKFAFQFRLCKILFICFFVHARDVNIGIIQSNDSKHPLTKLIPSLKYAKRESTCSGFNLFTLVRTRML